MDAEEIEVKLLRPASKKITEIHAIHKEIKKNPDFIQFIQRLKQNPELMDLSAVAELGDMLQKLDQIGISAQLFQLANLSRDIYDYLKNGIQRRIGMRE